MHRLVCAFVVHKTSNSNFSLFQHFWQKSIYVDPLSELVFTVPSIKLWTQILSFKPAYKNESGWNSDCLFYVYDYWEPWTIWPRVWRVVAPEDLGRYICWFPFNILLLPYFIPVKWHHHFFRYPDSPLNMLKNLEIFYGRFLAHQSLISCADTNL